MIERKIVINGCMNCPFREVSHFYENTVICSEFDLDLDEKEVLNIEYIHIDCMLPINIKSENII